jgi:hypothetical protein
MIETHDTDIEEFAGRLDALFGAPPAGRESPKMGADRFLEAAGNSFSHTLYLSLGSGPLAAAATCGALTVLGLAFARVLEEV